MRAIPTRASLPFALAAMLLALPGCGGCTPASSQPSVRTDPPPQKQRDSDGKARQDASSSSPAKSHPSPATSQSRAGRPPAGERGAAARSGVKAGSNSRTADLKPAGESPQSACATARNLRSSAASKSQDGDHKEAFEDAARAYGLVRQFPDDRECRELADALLRDLESLETRADAGSGTKPDNFKTLILQ